MHTPPAVDRASVAVRPWRLRAGVSDLRRMATLAVLVVVVALATATPVCADPTPVTAGKHAPAERHSKSSHPSKPTTHPKKGKAVAHASTKPAVKGHTTHPVETRSAKRLQAQVPRTGKSGHHETGQGHTAPVKAKRVTPKAHPEDERAFDPDDFNTRSGCAAPSREHDNLWSAIGIEDEGFRSLLVREASRILQSEQACVPYALLVDPDNHPLALALAVYDPHTDLTMLFLFNRDDQTHAMHFQSDSIPTHPRHTHVESFLLQDALSRPDGLQSSIPDSMLFELSGLATTLADAANRADAEDCLVRLVYDDGDSASPTRLQSLELLDRRTGQNLGHALWLDRPDLPGGYFTPNGDSFERQFWTSPVTFTHISRGVGASTIRLRWVGHSKSKARKKHSIQHTRVRSENHIGVDFAAPKGTPVLSVADGRVVFSGPAGGYGNLVIIEHPGGYTTHYGHLNAFATTTYIGAEVHRGQEIGYVGTTGLSTGYHLHFEIRLNGAYLDPLDPSQPFALWTLRKSDYIPLVRQILLANLTLMASDTGLPTRGQ